MGRYDTKGWDAGYNAAAQGAAQNGGNLDSFAAANAMRQQAALRNEGEAMALAAHNQKIQNIAGILANLGVEVQNDFDRSQTEKINDSNIRYQDAETRYKDAETEYKKAEKDKLYADIEKMQSEITGLVPDGMLPDYTDPKNNQFLNSDGSVSELENEGGYATIMMNALVTVASKTASEEEKLSAVETYNKANTARNMLLQSNPELMKQYGHTIKNNIPVQTLASRAAWADLELQKYAIDKDLEGLKYESDTAFNISDRESRAAEKVSEDNKQATITASENEKQSVIAAANAAKDEAIEAEKIKAEAKKYGYDTSLEIAKTQNSGGNTASTEQSSGGGTAPTNSTTYSYDDIVNKLNEINKNYHNDPNAEAIKKNKDGSYSVVEKDKDKKTGSDTWGIVVNTYAMAYDGFITEVGADEFLNSVGITDDMIKKVFDQLPD